MSVLPYNMDFLYRFDVLKSFSYSTPLQDAYCDISISSIYCAALNCESGIAFKQYYEQGINIECRFRHDLDTCSLYIFAPLVEMDPEEAAHSLYSTLKLYVKSQSLLSVHLHLTSIHILRLKWRF